MEIKKPDHAIPGYKPKWNDPVRALPKICKDELLRLELVQEPGESKHHYAQRCKEKFLSFGNAPEHLKREAKK